LGAGAPRVRDEDNLWPTLKAVVDALTPQRAVPIAAKNGKRGRVAVHVGAGIIPDDTSQYVARRSPHIEPPDPADPHMFVVIRARAGTA
jgi:hypothetical protein